MALPCSAERFDRPRRTFGVNPTRGSSATQVYEKKRQITFGKFAGYFPLPAHNEIGLTYGNIHTEANLVGSKSFVERILRLSLII